MITKKLAVPLINEKILQQSVHCYIATSSMTEEGFEFIRSRIPAKCKMDIVTGLDEPTSPSVLWKILRNYQGRINLNIYTRNVLHANMFVFDLPFRKSIAFVGSGTLSLEGIKDSEDLFWKITDAKEIESLMSWYTSYFQFGEPLTEKIAQGYETLYRRLRARAIRSAQEKRDMMSLIAASSYLESVKFRGQFFKREDFTVLSIENAFSDNAALRLSRAALSEKLLQLHTLIADPLSRLQLELDGESERSSDPARHIGTKVDSLSLVYEPRAVARFFKLRFGITGRDVFLSATIGDERETSDQRRLFFQRLEEPSLLREFFRRFSTLKGYSVEAGGKSRMVTSFRDEGELLSYLTTEDASLFDIKFLRRHLPGEPQLTSGAIEQMVVEELGVLSKLI